MINYKEKLTPIRAFVFDFDGVLSEGGVWVINSEIVRRTSVKDGYAIQYAVKKGYTIAVISGATAPSIEFRMNTLGVTQVYMGCANKLETYRWFLKKKHLKEEEVVVMGDDIPDYEMMQHCGVAACPADAVTEIKEVVDYVSLYPGGNGCARDIIEQVMRLHGQWFHKDAIVW